MLNAGFDGIFFGHTHKGYIGRPSVEVMSGLLNDRRKRPSFLKKLIPKFFLQKADDESLVSYKRESARNGQLPTLEMYFDYLYLRQRGYTLMGPSQFNSIRDFYGQMNGVSVGKRIKDEIEQMKLRRILISLAPSACQAEAEWNGFHAIEFDRDDKGALKVAWDRFEFDASEFKIKPRDMHVS